MSDFYNTVVMTRVGPALLVLATTATVSLTATHAEQPVLAAPIDAITGILDAFRVHDVVALGEGPHGNEPGHQFRLSLIRDPRFAAAVDDVLVEFGTGRQQAVMDRFVNGEDVPNSVLRRVWEDATLPNPAWERPIYEEFFRALRALNASLDAEHRVRVLLGDAPIDWATVKTRDDLRRWGLQKDQYSASVIKRDVLAKKRKVLVIYGDGHLQGRGFPGGSLTVLLERPPYQTKVFAISSSLTDLSRFQPDSASWPVPSIAKVRGTVIGKRPYASFYPIPPAPGWDQVRMEDQFDAVLYLGPPARTIMSYGFPPALCSDTEYMTMRLARMAINSQSGGRNRGIEELKAFCSAQRK
jgi:hypothetical protein